MTSELDRELIRVTGGSVQVIDGVLHTTTGDWYEPMAVVTDPRALLASLKTMPDYTGAFDPDSDTLVRFLVGMMGGVIGSR